jgi:hypothetical protein
MNRIIYRSASVEKSIEDVIDRRSANQTQIFQAVNLLIVWSGEKTPDLLWNCTAANHEHRIIDPTISHQKM